MSSHSEKLDTVVSSVKDMQKLLEDRGPDSVPDLSAVLGKISAVSEQVRNAIQEKDKIISLQEELNAHRNRAQLLLNMAPSVVRSEETLMNAILYLVPHVSNGTFQKEEIRAMVNS